MNLNNIEYIVYDGFDSFSNALTTIAHVFKDSAYGGLFFVSAVLGIFIGLMAYFYKRASGGEVSPLAMFLPLVTGLFIYVSLFIPKTKITVYDQSTGLFQTFGDIPLGIGVVAGITNKVETGLIDIFDTSSLYKDAAGGKGVAALIALHSEAGSLDPALDRSMDEFIEDCYAFEVGRPGGTIDFNKVVDGTLSLEASFENAKNPAIFTITYLKSGGSPTGDAVSCSNAWDLIKGKLQQSNLYEKPVKAACKNAGFYEHTLSFDKCETMLRSHIAYLKAASANYGNPAYDLSKFVTRLYLTRRIDYFAREGLIVPFGNYNIGVQSISTSLMLNQWIPYIKSVLTALVFSITPLVLVFLPTPLFGRVISLIFGFFVWLLFWSVSDAIVHNSMGVVMHNFFESFRSKIAPAGDIGYGALLNMTTPAAKTLAVLGYVRSGAIILATVLTRLLVKFGGETLAQFAGSITGAVSTTGAQAGYQTKHALGAASTIDSASTAAATHDVAAKYSLDTRWAGKVGAMGWNLAEGMGKDKALQHFRFGTVAQAIANREAGMIGSGSAPEGMIGYFNAEAMKTKFGIKYGTRELATLMSKYTPEQYALAKATMPAEILGQIDGLVEKGRNIFGFEGDEYSVLRQMAAFRNRGGVVDSQMAKSINDKLFGGENIIKAGMRVDVGIADGKIYLTAQAQDGSGSLEVKDGRLIEKGVLRDANVSGYKFSGSYIKETSLTDGKTISTYTGIINGKEGHLTVDYNGKAVFVEGKSGYSETNYIDRVNNVSGVSWERHHGNAIDYYGQRFDFGNDFIGMFFDNNTTEFFNKYGSAFSGNIPTTMGRALVDDVARIMGGYGKIAQGVQDILSASLKAGVGFDSSRAALGKMLSLWGINIDINASLEGQRRAIESIDANTIAIGMQNRYADIMRSGRTAKEKAAQFLYEVKQFAELLEQNAKETTFEQMIEGVKNPAKGQGIDTNWLRHTRKAVTKKQY